MLSFLLGAYNLTADTYFMDHFDALFHKHEYKQNIKNTRVTAAWNVNFSDDELNFLAYLLFSVSAASNPDLMRVGASAVRNHFRFIDAEKTPFFLFVYASFGDEYVTLVALTAVSKTIQHPISFRLSTGRLSHLFISFLVWFSRLDERLLEDAAETLRTWPMEQIEWNVNFTRRIDVRYNTQAHVDDREVVGSTRVLPAHQRPLLRLNGDPFKAYGGSDVRCFSLFVLPFCLSSSYYYHMVFTMVLLFILLSERGVGPRSLVGGFLSRALPWTHYRAEERESWEMEVIIKHVCFVY